MLYKPNYEIATNKAYVALSLNPYFVFNIDVFCLARLICSCDIIPYSSTPSKSDGSYLFEAVSDHGFLTKKSDTREVIIFYNDKDSLPVIRFTIAHEIGHFVLGHSDNDGPAAEKEANCFARNLLCPLPVADFFKLRGVEDYAGFFKVSRTMASITLSQRHCDRELIQKDLYDKIKQMTYERAQNIYPTADFGFAI